jgi:DNA-binding CsgD family transcriptional regulator
MRLSSYLLDAVTRLRASDLEAVLAFVAEARAIDGPEPFPTELLGRLGELVPCEAVFFNGRDVVRREILSESYWCVDGLEDHSWRLEEDEWSLIGRHPLNVHRRRTGDFGVRHVSDLYSRRRRVRGEIYADYFGRCGIVDITGLPLTRSKTHTLNLGFESWGRDFTERDRCVLEHLRPHLWHTYRDAGVRRLFTAALTALDTGNELGIVLLGGDRIEFASRPARQLLKTYFGERRTRLPAEIDDWLRDPSARGEPYTAAYDGHRLVVEVGADRSMLLLREEPNTVALTPREGDVMRCVAAGLSNTEIAQLLWVTVATVRKHLENVYGKLGVRSRTAAVAKLGPHLAEPRTSAIARSTRQP